MKTKKAAKLSQNWKYLLFSILALTLTMVALKGKENFIYRRGNRNLADVYSSEPHQCAQNYSIEILSRPGHPLSKQLDQGRRNRLPPARLVWSLSSAHILEIKRWHNPQRFKLRRVFGLRPGRLPLLCRCRRPHITIHHDPALRLG